MLASRWLAIVSVMCMTQYVRCAAANATSATNSSKQATDDDADDNLLETGENNYH